MERLDDGDCSGPFAAPSPRAWWSTVLLNGAPDPTGRARAAHADHLFFHLETDPVAPAAAREIAARVLREWHMAALVPDVELVVSELVTNALRHGSPPGRPGVPDDPIRMGLLRRGGEFVCAVRDRGERMPIPREPDLRLENGRGLHLVACFCRAWGVLPVLPQGKYVWASFH
ncbi:ATP-binding protein [Streptomonospora sp. S1-112]|uniref:ATP-binding protein n=1 Tax=Streptomonospora mangrovi TaxID=2883123 RepID=A0A9X3NGK8_9ACTN|nr:ATP-binding protein [Streptomonospora mangrovi]MDA0563212.1 ATP-binding protein [Streptomonospora mangrovi]